MFSALILFQQEFIMSTARNNRSKWTHHRCFLTHLIYTRSEQPQGKGAKNCRRAHPQRSAAHTPPSLRKEMSKNLVSVEK